MKWFELPGIVGSIVAVGVALGAVVIGSNANPRTELRSERHGLRSEFRADIRALESRPCAVEQRQASAEGLPEGLRDAIAARGMPPSPGAQGGAS